tara:strand:- start:1868 stop:2875 length:1008 start_codon:yes stop_codon:yes gene_type:complete
LYKDYSKKQQKIPIKIILAQPRGFCAGVVRAIEIVERALEIHGPPIYVRHEIVHNTRVIETLKDKGVIFVEELSDVPLGSVTIFSAHGVAKVVELSAEERKLTIFDATCPLVTKVHNEGRRAVKKGFELVLIGHVGHPEVEGTMGQVPGVVHLVSSLKDAEVLMPADPEKISYITQTTLSVDDTKGIISVLKRRFPKIEGPDINNICYATQNRQEAVRSLSRIADVVLVVGSNNSSNSNRLVEIALSCKKRAYLVEDFKNLDYSWFDGCSSIGITAGASAPENLIEEIVISLGKKFDIEVIEAKTSNENISFKIPAELERTNLRSNLDNENKLFV